ncbi:hypothetical protein SO802_031209 [Lithocarpus litseifolius]|uniref:Uncharacterized protein n=1 Tax=Lithocarpus litseifolius TaxID=425828 RepID=A0AAW2BL16_9ROSI
MMANDEDVIFSDYDDFIFEHEKGKAVIDQNIGWSSDPILKINLSRPCKIPLPPPPPPPNPNPTLPPAPTVATAYPRPKWFPYTKLSEEERYEYSLYGEMLLEHYNEVKGTDFEFVRLVKIMVMLVAGLNIKIHFEAKSCAAAAENTLKTFEGFVFKAFVCRHRVWPLSCQLLCPNPVYDERISPSHLH